MSKFNEKKVDKDLTLNEEEALAYKKSEKEALVSMVLTTFYNEDKFYGDNSEELVELAKVIADLKDILEKPERVKAIIRADMEYIKEKSLGKQNFKKPTKY